MGVASACGSIDMAPSQQKTGATSGRGVLD
jgi:hypothetical protein